MAKRVPQFEQEIQGKGHLDTDQRIHLDTPLK
jgi:hypothetical protein